MANGKTRILFLMHNIVMGGMEMVLKNLLEELKHRDDLDVAVFGHVGDDYFSNWFNENRDRIKLYNNFLHLPRERGLTKRITRSIRKRITKSRIELAMSSTDIVIDFRNGENHKFLKGFKGKKIVWFHGGFNYFIKDMPVEEILKYDQIVCLTESFKNDFIAAFPQYANKIAQIYNAIPYNEIAEKAKKGERPDGKYFVSVARMGEDKDVATIVLGFDKFWRDNGRPDVRLYLIGDGPKKRLVQNLANLMESRENIIFAGKIPEPFGYMHGAIANILSSPQEGLPTTLIEAAAAGTVNISSDVKSGPPEILMQGRAGLLFPYGDFNSLAKSMSDVYNEKINREELIENGTKALKRFDTKSIAEQFIKVIK
jgi:glycosyltransferase involved in cell wall biosynthesis